MLDEIDEAEHGLGLQLSRLVGIVARVDPESTSFVIARLVERLGAPRIAADDGLAGPIREALEHLRHRRISSLAFEAVEASLFSLAVEKQEPWGNNAKAVWASLFQAIVHQTHQGFDARVGLLRWRLASTESSKRQVALEGLARLMAGESGSFHAGLDDADGPWEHPTNREVLDRQRLGWHLLAQMTEDLDAEVSGRARGLIAEYFSLGLSSASMDDVLDELPAKVARWTPMERNALRDAVEWALERYNRSEHSQPDDIFERLTELRGGTCQKFCV